MSLPAEKLLIYDGNCAYCRAFVAALQKLDGRERFRVLEFDSPRALEVLRVQFGGRYGFALYLFELDIGEVSWGREAVRRAVWGLGWPRSVAYVAFWLYPVVVRLVSRLTRRTRRVCGPECAGTVHPGSRRRSLPLREETRALLRSSQSSSEP